MRQAAVDFPLIQASATDVPLPDASFDVVFCDHGAFTFTDPRETIPEAARLLRPGGLLAFSMITAFADAHWREEDEEPGETLVRDYFGMHRFVDETDDTISFMLPHSATIAALRGAGFDPQPGSNAWNAPRVFVRCPAGHRVELMSAPPYPPWPGEE
jgi:SAM-dependent methyltransferase